MDQEIRKKKTLILVLGALLLLILMATVPVLATLLPGDQAVARIFPDLMTTTVLPGETAGATAFASATVAALQPTETPEPAEEATAVAETTAAAQATVAADATTVANATIVAEATVAEATAAAEATATPTTTPTMTPTAEATPTATPSPTPSPNPTATFVPGVDKPTSAALPVPQITSPTTGTDLYGGDWAVEGTAPAGMTVLIYGGDGLLGQAVTDEEGRWTFSLSEPLPEGEYELVARTTDGEHVSEPSSGIMVTVIGERLPVTGAEHP